MPRLFSILFCISFCLSSVFGQGNKLKEADAFFESKEYSKALNHYLALNRQKPGVEHVLTRLGICYYFTNNTTLAKQSLKAVNATTKKPNSSALLYLGKSHHADNEFIEASTFYKEYLKNTKLDDPLREHIRDAIKRCGAGIRTLAIKANAIVENLGNTINTEEDDFGAVLSPNYDDRIYFSSVRKTTNKPLSSDIFLATLTNGSWSDIRPLEGLNSIQNDHILDFNEDGQALIYWRGNNEFSGQIMVDTFSSDGIAKRGNYISPIQSENGDGGGFLFNDTTLLFHSYRKGGYGGSDLYFAKYRDGVWSNAFNLGPEINSRYDEISPFLSNDGSTLYFSSNNTNSMGGFDIFKSTFEIGLMKWTLPENLGVPINSGRNDLQLRIEKNGLRGYLTSNRPQSLGKQDIFVVYFKNYLPEQQSENIISSLRPPIERITEDLNPNEIGRNETKFDENQIQKYQIGPFYYDDSDIVILPENISDLRKAVQVMQQYPALMVEVIGSSDVGAAMEFDLYFSVKRAEEVAQYFTDNGIDRKRISIRGCGQNYPVIRNSINNQPVLIAKKLNRRVDLLFKNMNGLPIEIQPNKPRVNNTSLELSGIRILENHSRGISYRVKFAITENMYNGKIISEYPDAMIDKPTASDQYRYTVGLYITYQSAQFMKNDLIKQGIIEAEVIAFVNGMEVDKNAALKLVDDYPDLVNFLVNE